MNTLLDVDKPDPEKIQKEQKETVVRPAQPSQMQTILATQNVSLLANKNPILGGRKQEDVKIKAERKKKVIVYCTSLFLNNNDIRTLNGLND